MFSFPLVFALGFAEIDRVDIAWNDRPKVPKPHCKSHGELFLRVTMSGEGNSRFWATLLNNCLPIMDLIDWSRSHPDNTHSLCLAYGIDSGWKYFLNVSNFLSSTLLTSLAWFLHLTIYRNFCMLLIEPLKYFNAEFGVCNVGYW